ncbi:MAG TPA: PAS domain-containing protein [Gemmatimonadaceae bacterium]
MTGERPVGTATLRRGVTIELRRAGWMSATALATIALTVLAIALFAPRGHPRPIWIATSVVGMEVIVALIATIWLSRQVTSHAEAFEASVAATDAAHARAEAEAHQKTRLTALIDAALGCSPVGFAFFDPSLRFLRVNSAITRMSGRAAEEHVGLTLRDVHPWLARDVEPLLRRVLESRRAVANKEIVSRAPNAGGPARTWLTSCFPIETSDGELFGVGLALSDITEFKRMEEQFLQAQKMEAVGRLAGGVAHDFNNLLTVINSYAELMLYNPALEEGRGEIEEIRGATARAAKLTRQLLAFSRRQPLEPQIVNPNDVCRGVESLLRGLKGKGVQIVTHLSPDTPLIRVDPVQLEQVVMNLAFNAIDAMDGGGRLGIETHCWRLDETNGQSVPELAPGLYAMIRVTDTGHGMSQETLSQIWEPFFTTKEPDRGTGLGLPTAYGIVKQSGGDIAVDSEQGAGTEFTVYFPAVQ